MQTCNKLKKLQESKVRVQQVSTDWCEKELCEERHGERIVLEKIVIAGLK